MNVCNPPTDPRIKRTRQMLRQALSELLKEKSFDDISVQDIADRSTVNRATFYDHFSDKSELLGDWIGESFHESLTGREVDAAGNCPEALKRLILSVCDYLDHLNKGCKKHQRQFEPFVEAKVKASIREILMEGLRRCSPRPAVSLELVTTVASWAIYGAALEWSRSDHSQSSEVFTAAVFPLIEASLKMAQPCHDSAA